MEKKQLQETSRSEDKVLTLLRKLLLPKVQEPGERAPPQRAEITEGNVDGELSFLLPSRVACRVDSKAQDVIDLIRDVVPECETLLSIRLFLQVAECAMILYGLNYVNEQVEELSGGLSPLFLEETVYDKIWAVQNTAAVWTGFLDDREHFEPEIEAFRKSFEWSRVGVVNSWDKDIAAVKQRALKIVHTANKCLVTDIRNYDWASVSVQRADSSSDGWIKIVTFKGLLLASLVKLRTALETKQWDTLFHLIRWINYDNHQQKVQFLRAYGTLEDVIESSEIAQCSVEEALIGRYLAEAAMHGHEECDIYYRNRNVYTGYPKQERTYSFPNSESGAVLFSDRPIFCIYLSRFYRWLAQIVDPMLLPVVTESTFLWMASNDGYVLSGRHNSLARATPSRCNIGTYTDATRLGLEGNTRLGFGIVRIYNSLRASLPMGENDCNLCFVDCDIATPIRVIREDWAGNYCSPSRRYSIRKGRYGAAHVVGLNDSESEHRTLDFFNEGETIWVGGPGGFPGAGVQQGNGVMRPDSKVLDNAITLTHKYVGKGAQQEYEYQSGVVRNMKVIGVHYHMSKHVVKTSVAYTKLSDVILDIAKRCKMTAYKAAVQLSNWGIMRDISRIPFAEGSHACWSRGAYKQGGFNFDVPAVGRMFVLEEEAGTEGWAFQLPDGTIVKGNIGKQPFDVKSSIYDSDFEQERMRWFKGFEVSISNCTPFFVGEGNGEPMLFG